MKESAVDGCCKRFCPNLVQDLKGFEENLEAATK
jgi:hypothetical protein